MEIAFKRVEVALYKAMRWWEENISTKDVEIQNWVSWLDRWKSEG